MPLDRNLNQELMLSESCVFIIDVFRVDVIRFDVFRFDGFTVDVFRVDGFRVDVFWFVTFCILKDFCEILYAAYFHFELLHAAGQKRLRGHALVFFSQGIVYIQYDITFRLNMNEMGKKSEIFTAENDPGKME